ncbi:MAG: hypothetical protein IPF99_36370 [Deltaproteobacteria bacterium]|nr:hypothetical protein [Deltaproteobacteria bacterium]
MADDVTFESDKVRGTIDEDEEPALNASPRTEISMDVEGAGAEIDAIRERINRHRRRWTSTFVKRTEEIDSRRCARARRSRCFVGPPGTAKSDPVVKSVESLGPWGEDYLSTC